MSPQRRQPTKAASKPRSTAKPKSTTKAKRIAPAPSLPTAPVEQALESDLNADRLIHAAAVRAGAGAALHYVLDSLPLLKPFIPAALRRRSASLEEDKVQAKLVRDIYALHGLKPARWELDGVMAVAQSHAVMTPLATRAGVQSMISAWLPKALAGPVIRFSPIEPLVVATARAVSGTWAAGRYADNVCKLRRVGADWLPAPLTEAMRLAPGKLREWSAEALSLAIPPIRMTKNWFKQE
ncbi:MAG: hypothetical protein Q8L45_08185 [Xanthomonadaceae bacterium]|nr:hypothetical protein [Xanthomonadaceae bacterium]MDP2184044.1 hypothetical protein [Xanthomonadales bacterium]MDZ4115284.1 hypothetical protein [Xanthomonadaceae bacterium]MDZ4377326.1 hypothetical protein [Xanthomonadaceae bacterium]